jgi:hypothetical protein
MAPITGPPSPASPASVSKGAGRRSALSSLSLPRSPPPTATRASNAPYLFTPLIHAADRVATVPARFRPPPSPPTVRPANLPPFSYLGRPHLCRPPSQLQELAGVATDPPSSEDTAACRRTEPPPPPHSRPPPSVSPAFAPVARRRPKGPRELVGNTLPMASHHRLLSYRTTTPSCVRAARGDHVPARPARAQRRGHAGRSLAGPGRQAEVQPAFRPAVCGRPPALHCSRGPILARHCAANFKSFFNLFNFQKILQTSKIRRNL